MEPDHLLRTLRGCGEPRDRDGRGVGAKDRIASGGLLHLADHAVLELQVFEDRLDDEIDCSDFGPIDRAPQARFTLRGDVGLHLARLYATGVVLANARRTALQRGGVLFEQDDVEARIESGDRDPRTLRRVVPEPEDVGPLHIPQAGI